MSQASIAAIAKIIQEVLNHQEPIDASSDAQSVSGWDSLNHMMIIAAIEKRQNYFDFKAKSNFLKRVFKIKLISFRLKTKKQ